MGNPYDVAFQLVRTTDAHLGHRLPAEDAVAIASMVVRCAGAGGTMGDVFNIIKMGFKQRGLSRHPQES